MKAALQMACALALGTFLGGCATKNDAGVILYKKPDLSKVAPGTPINKVAGLRKPVQREVITKGKLKGAEAWLYEWDLPHDEVNNKMFTAVFVKDGTILGYSEDTADKWSKNPKLFEAAKFSSAFEDYNGYMAQAAAYGAAAAAFRSMADNYRVSANQMRYQQTQNAQAWDMMMRSSMPAPWERSRQSQSPSYTQVQPDLIGGLVANDGTRLQPDLIGGYRSSDGEQFNPDLLGGFRGNKGTQLNPDLIGGYRVTR